MKVVIKKSTTLIIEIYGNIYRTIKVKRYNNLTHFGAAGFYHYPIHKDDERKKRYIDRHKKSENWNNKFSAG